MNPRFFGQFLIARGEIDAAQLREALDLADRENRSIGEIAVSEDLLAPDDAERIHVQQRVKDRPFGALAIEMGLLAENQLDELLRRQREKRLPLGEALVRLGHLEAARLGGLLDAFKAGQAELGSGVLPEALDESRLASYLIELLPRLSVRLAGLPMKLGPGAPLAGPTELPHRCSLSIRGRHGALRAALGADRELAARLAAGATAMEEATLRDDMLGDGLAEFLNVVAGNAMSALEQQGVVLELGAPDRDPRIEVGTGFEIATPEGRGILVLAPA